MQINFVLTFYYSPDSLLLTVLIAVLCVQGGVAVTAGLPESFTMVSYLISHYFITIPL